jgi:protein-L-isoaspartate(D-aspartate) O-methyltransferase
VQVVGGSNPLAPTIFYATMKNNLFQEELLDKMNREKMVSHLTNNGFLISDKVKSAMSRVPRHLFIDSALKHKAYDDIHLPVGFEQTISKPSTVAKMTELLLLENSHRVLEIGTGSGYQTAVLAELCLKVYSVEWHLQLAKRARGRLYELGYSTARIENGDGSQGWPAAAPFDRIIITAGAPAIPETVCYQLKTNGIMVVPVGTKQCQELLVIQRSDPDDEPVFEIATHGPCEFVDLVGKLGWPESG